MVDDAHAVAGERRAGQVESARAEVFDSVIGRIEKNWKAHGFDVEQKRVWLERGVPEDRAHWAVIIRELDSWFKSVRIRPRTVAARRLVKGGREEKLSVLGLLEEGCSGARISRYLSEYRGIENAAPAAIQAAIDPRTIQVPVTSLPALNNPANVAQLITRLADRAGSEISALDPVDQLKRQAREYLDSGGVRVGAFLAAAAGNYGVVSPGIWMAALAGNWADDDTLSAALVAARTFREIDVDRHLFYAGRQAARQMVYEKFGAALTPRQPAAAGLLVLDLPKGDDAAPDRIVLAWSNTPKELVIVRATESKLARHLANPRITREYASVVRIRHADATATVFGSTRGVSELAAFTAQYRAESNSRQKSSTDAHRAGESRERPVVVIRYHRNTSAAGNHAESPTGHVYDGIRWRVRGHWRNQWYPSEKVHRPKWIEEHDAGHSPAGTLIERDIVTKLP